MPGSSTRFTMLPAADRCRWSGTEARHPPGGRRPHAVRGAAPSPALRSERPTAAHVSPDQPHSRGRSLAMQALVRGWASGSHPPPPPLEVLCPLATEHPRPAGEPANADDIVEIRYAASQHRHKACAQHAPSARSHLKQQLL